MTPLADRLRSLAGAIDAGKIRSPDLERLELAVDTATSCAERSAALRRLAELLAYDLPSRWTLAKRIAKALDDFERSPDWCQIRDGKRRPRSTFESAAAVVLRCQGPRSARWIWEALTD